MREPSIHITLTKLGSILEDILDPAFKNFGTLDGRVLASAVADKAKGYSLSNRSVTVTNDKLKRDANKVTLSGRSDTVVFSEMITILRRQRKHRGIVMPKPGTMEFLQLKEPTKLANDFMHEFGLEKKLAYKLYINMALDKMKNFTVYKFANLHSTICKEYEATQRIAEDRNSIKTQEAHDYYMGIISRKVGFVQGYEKSPDKYCCFLDVAALCTQYKIRITTYIDSQFAAFDWKAGVPDPYQLVGDRALERWQKYAYENGVAINEEDTPKFNFTAIKNAK